MVKFSKMLLFGLAALSVGKFECVGDDDAKQASVLQDLAKAIGGRAKTLKPFVGGFLDVALIHAAFSAIRAMSNVDKDMDEKTFVDKCSEFATKEFYAKLWKELGGKNKKAKFLNFCELALIVVYLVNSNYRGTISPINLISKLATKQPIKRSP